MRSHCGLMHLMQSHIFTIAYDFIAIAFSPHFSFSLLSNVRTPIYLFIILFIYLFIILLTVALWKCGKLLSNPVVEIVLTLFLLPQKLVSIELTAIFRFCIWKTRCAILLRNEPVPSNITFL